MNQNFSTLKTLRSSARFTETERSRAFISKTLRSPASAPRPAPTQSGPASVLSYLRVLCVSKFILTLLLVSPCFAWDDDDTDSKPFHRSNYNQQSSAIDYGYKNNNQQNTSIDYGYKNPYQAN